MRLPAILLILLVPAALLAQVSTAASANTRSAPPAAPTQLAPAAVASSLPQLQQLTENTRVDLAKLRVDKWKTDANTKQQTQANVSSLQRNMTSAMPEMINAVQANPASVAASVKLYRNLNVLYDVLAVVAESAGAFGPRDEYAALASDVQNLDNMRRTIADQLELLAASKDAELTRVEAQLRQATTAAASAAPPKKIVVDENEPAPKKPVQRKKKAAPAAKPSSQ